MFRISGYQTSFQLEPDFTITRNEKFITILDTKYKYPFDKYGQIKIDTDDLYQLSTYAIRYNCKNLVIIYPKFLGINAKNDLLTDYRLITVLGDIRLMIVQIDIMEKDITKLTMNLKRIIYPKEELEFVS
ncbi:MAG: hypothetical protein IPH97_06375 [Ignavibacteriales bacterium]|nr:hypothetical protein [Ignavibacteriales bacterium]